MYKLIKCPYYVAHSKGRVECESLKYSKETTTHFIQGHTGEYLKKYCAEISGWSLCPFAAELNRKYSVMEVAKMEVIKKCDAEYELGRYKKKVIEQMEVEKKLREQLGYKDMLLENAMLYMVHLGVLAAEELPCTYKVDYISLRKQVEKYEISYEPVENKGMILTIKEK